jgi:PAS domain S-box-containing protein
MPLFAGKQVNGYISLQNLDMEGAFHPADVRLLETIGNSLSIALENARHFDETQRLLDETRQRNAELAVINSVQHGLATHLDMQSIYELVGEQVREIFASDTTMIAFYDRENKIFDMPYYADREMRLSGKTSHGSGLAEIAIETGKPLLCGTKEEWSNRGARHIPSPGSEEDLNESVLFVPVFRRGEVTGVISVQSYQQHAYDEGDVRLMTTLANSMSVALENARLFAETQRLLDETAQRAAELATVNTVNRALAAEMDLDSLIQLTGEQMRITFNADIVYVALLEPATGEIKLPYTFGEQPTSIRMGQGLTSKILETGQPLLINKEIKARREQLGATQVGREAASYLGVPVIVGKQPIGVISVQSTEEEDRFTENDVRLLSTLAANVAIAISNARLFEEVSRQKKYYEMIIANSPAAIVVINNQFIVTSWNPAAERLFGYTVEEAVGQNVDSLVANLPEINPEAVSFSHRGLQEKQFHFFSKRTRKDSSLVDVEAMGLPVIENGIITSYIVIYHDITELERARREAIEANQAKSTFLANMSHELRTPLNAIIGFTRIVRRKGADQLPEKQLENLDKVLVSADHLLGLINTVLDIAKIEAGRLEVQLSTFELTPLVELVINTTQPLVRSSRVKLSAEVAPDLGPVRTDLEKLKQILLNLLSNAAKFTHHGRIQLKARREAEMLVVDVADTGIGMGPEALQRVFDEFQQADSSTTREYGGTGLGLSISRSLTELLGGELSAVSEAGVGSTFTLRLPLQPAQEADEPEALLRAEQPGNGAAGAPVQSSPARERPLVLVIDDQPNAVDLLRENLEEAGYRVAFAYSGQQGIKLAVQLQPAAITLDVMMPTKDGWQVLHELKANPDTRRIPVILITVVDNKPLGFRLGAADYLVKPLDEQQVLDSLAHLSSRAGGKKPSCLLVVDDDPDVRVWVQQILENSRYEVRTAADGEQALAQIQEEMPEAILLDLVMPNMDGFSLIERLRSQPETQAIPIIVFTAKDLTAAETDALNSSVTAVIHKQGLPEQVLLQQITAAMEPSQVKGE